MKNRREIFEEGAHACAGAIALAALGASAAVAQTSEEKPALQRFLLVGLCGSENPTRSNFPFVWARALEEARAAGAEAERGTRRVIEAASGRVARRCAAGAGRSRRDVIDSARGQRLHFLRKESGNCLGETGQRDSGGDLRPDVQRPGRRRQLLRSQSCKVR